jgi:hypothetical protein
MSIAKIEFSCKVVFFPNRSVAAKSWYVTKISPILDIIVTITWYLLRDAIQWWREIRTGRERFENRISPKI